MDVDQTLNDLCVTYGVSSLFAERIRPLVERAMSSEPEKRERLLAIVERSFAEEARTHPKGPPMLSRLTPEELGVLKTVAGILHAWNPPAWLSVWERYIRKREG